MADSFTKLFSSIIHSSIWSEDDQTRLVWVTMLALADAEGYVGASVPGLARAARVELKQCEFALERLQSPDKYSRSQAHEGRRIEPAERGWRILNYIDFRERATDAERRRKREWWRKHRAKNASNYAELAAPSDCLDATRHKQRQKQKQRQSTKVDPHADGKYLTGSGRTEPSESERENSAESNTIVAPTPTVPEAPDQNPQTPGRDHGENRVSSVQATTHADGDETASAPGYGRAMPDHFLQAFKDGSKDRQVREIFNLFKTICKRPGVKLTPRYRGLHEILELLSQGETPADFKSAFQAAMNDPWVRSTGPKLSVIVCDRERYEALRDAQSGPEAPDLLDKIRRAVRSGSRRKVDEVARYLDAAVTRHGLDAIRLALDEHADRLLKGRT